MAFGPAVAALFVAVLVAPAMARSAAAIIANAPASSPEATEAESTPAAPVPAVLFVFSPDWRPADLGHLGATLEDAGSSGGLELSVTQQDVGTSTGHLDAKYEGNDLTIAFNPQFLIDGIDAIEGDEVALETKDNLKPATLRSAEGGDYVYLLMPVRTA